MPVLVDEVIRVQTLPSKERKTSVAAFLYMGFLVLYSEQILKYTHCGWSVKREHRQGSKPASKTSTVQVVVGRGNTL